MALLDHKKEHRIYKQHAKKESGHKIKTALDVKFVKNEDMREKKQKAEKADYNTFDHIYCVYGVKIPGRNA